MKLAIVNTLPVPSGNASVNRFLGYGKELVQLGVIVHVLSSASFEDNHTDGIYVRSCGRGKSLLGALIKIIRILKLEHYDAVILVSNSLLLIYPLWFICKILGVKFLQEKSEFPFVLRNTSPLGKLYATYYVNTTYKLFDGLIVMTKPLIEYFKGKTRKGVRNLEMPMTVDVKRFSQLPKKSNQLGDYIAYCGNMSGNKDGVENLIDAFSIACEKLPKIKLLLIGGANTENEFNRIKEIAKRKLSDRVVFYGRANRDEIPELLINAKALALARPSSLQSIGGFPTKLGEYLATGNPVIVTAVGDIPLYLNNTNAFVVQPDDNKMFAEAILEVFSDYKKAQGKGAEGKKLATSVFSAEIQAQRLFDFLKTVV